MIFEEKYFSRYILFSDQFSLNDYLYFFEVLDNTSIVSCPACDVMNFQINNSFLIKPFFYLIKKSAQKCKYLKNEKSF